MIYDRLIYAGKIFTGEKIKENIYIGIKDEKISYIGEKPTAASITEDFSDYILFPKFIDIHTHGSIGIDTNSASCDDFLKLAEYNAKCGLSAFMPTAVTDSRENIEKTLSEVGKAMQAQKKGASGAEILGLFLEGIFISSEKKGSHKAEYIEPPDLTFLDMLVQKYKGILKRAIIAPEVKNSEKAIHLLSRQGIKIGLGHSIASYTQTLTALRSGADSFIHIFNAMGKFDHRNSGILSAALLEDIYGEIICDFIHTDENAVKLLLRCKPHDKIILVTDNVCAKGTDSKICFLGEVPVYIKDGKAVTADGTLAGGNSDISTGVANMLSLGVPIKEAFAMGSLNPAKYLGIDDRFGKIDVGRKADISAIKLCNIKTASE